jgi:ParB family chromosome partitioning protein
MLIELHQLSRKYECLRVCNRREETSLLGSLEDEGQRAPVIVVEGDGEDAPFVVIDGFKRVRVAVRLGIDQLDCLVWGMIESDALVHLHTLQRPRERSSLEDAYLLRVLHEEHGLSQAAIAHRLGRTQSWVSRRLGLVRELPDWLQQHVQKGDVQCYVATKYLLPMARTNGEHAKLLARELAGMKVTTRDVADLYYAWKTGTEEEQVTVLTRPDLVLAARRAQSSGADGDEAPGIDAVLQDLTMAESLLRRALRLTGQLSDRGLEPWCVDSLRLRKRRVWEAITLLDNQLMEVINEGTGSGDTSSNSAAT